MKDGKDLEPVSGDSEPGLSVLRHSTAHIMAQAVKRLFPETKLAIGPSIENGFYYDFDLKIPLIEADLPRIEEEMRKIIDEDVPFTREDWPKAEAEEFFGGMSETYKLEILREIEDDRVGVYRQGEFVDLCRGPHIAGTGLLGKDAFKLTSVAGAYWRGDSNRPMLQRIYGTAFEGAPQLKDYLERLEEAERRDHRRLGKELDLFSLHEEAPGFPFFHPRGMVVRNVLESFWREEHRRRGYEEVRTPVILNEGLWRQSGHWDHYHENMYFTRIDERDFAVKPMNCPGAIILYKRKLVSYRDLPIRMAELGLVHRHELSGVLHGLMRVRAFTQDDAHLFLLPSQIQGEILGIIDLLDKVYQQVFGFSYHVEIGTKPENAMGDDEVWERATHPLVEALRARGTAFKLNQGDGAFYGPKIDFHLRDCLGRTWQCGTIQLDFLMPERFDLAYVAEDGSKQRPVMIHRVVFGSLERFMAILLEHFAGALPLWLSPVQVEVIPVAGRHEVYSHSVAESLAAQGIRAEVDGRNEKLGYKIRDAQLRKVPYMLVLGDREEAAGTVAVRHRRLGDMGVSGLTEFAGRVVAENRDMARDLESSPKPSKSAGEPR